MKYVSKIPNVWQVVIIMVFSTGLAWIIPGIPAKLVGIMAAFDLAGLICTGLTLWILRSNTFVTNYLRVTLFALNAAAFTVFSALVAASAVEGSLSFQKTMAYITVALGVVSVIAYKKHCDLKDKSEESLAREEERRNKPHEKARA